MQMEINVEELRNKVKLFITAPTFGGKCEVSYMTSMMNLTALLTRLNIQYDIWFLSNESLVQRGRNYCAHMFMENSNATHMLFVDADIGFNANDVVMMLKVMADDDNADVLAGAYPKKTITWEKIIEAVNQGYGEEDPNQLDDFVGDFVLNFDEATSFRFEDHKVPIAEIGTGFMMISRSGLEKFKAKYPEYAYTPDHARSAEFNGDNKVMQYFHTEIDKDSNRYLSEDYWFCRKLKAAGGNIYLAPWVYLQHTGTYVFGGKLPAISRVGAMTADKDKIKPRQITKNRTPQITKKEKK